jgi:NADPH-dependent 2,4-dienoyl-CoA reductase/sulfur reductase-like enzyme
VLERGGAGIAFELRGALPMATACFLTVPDEMLARAENSGEAVKAPTLRSRQLMTNNGTVDVVVVGGGPTGLLTAGELRRRGVAVSLVETRAQRQQEAGIQ